ncbi:RAMP superfamily CRISPR-associated protein [Rhabdothermincola sediminis]|uniref:RAMP superfamily CRISPR-associated protein n=1 Tax=Rhabdothermincola sediminis TaxID=2751370 RepID=UPI001AA04587|nr:RAMP superfamily CRISPR-associated protein [Rhabdothermincola sediminis]
MNGRGHLEQRPAYFFVDAPERPVAFEFDGPAWWGRLEFEFEVRLPVHVSAGAPVRVRFGDGSETIASDLVRVPQPGSDGEGLPVLPGTSLKGAARAVVEALTGSCEVFGPGRTCSSCAACALFGAMGQRGKVRLGDAVPVVESPTLVTIDIGQRYSHADAPKRGRRFYGLAPEQPEARQTETLLCIETGERLRCELGLAGVETPLVGALLAACGAGTNGLSLLRIGGGKNRSLGALVCEGVTGRVGPDLVAAIGPASRAVDDALVEQWIEAAEKHFAPRFAEVRARIDAEYRRGLP